MKQGTTLKELAANLLAQVPDKKDYVADTQMLRLKSSKEKGSRLQMAGDEAREFSVSDFSHRQIADRLGIPARYYERMKQQAPELLDTVNADLILYKKGVRTKSWTLNETGGCLCTPEKNERELLSSTLSIINRQLLWFMNLVIQTAEC